MQEVYLKRAQADLALEREIFAEKQSDLQNQLKKFMKLKKAQARLKRRAASSASDASSATTTAATPGRSNSTASGGGATS